MRAGGHATLQQRQAVAWFGKVVAAWDVRAVAGGQWDTVFGYKGESFVVDPGWIAGLSAGKNWRRQDGWRPHIGIGAALAVAAGNGPGNRRLIAGDLRLSGDVGWTFFERLDLHAVGRIFGGPVLWRNLTTSDDGNDRWHVQLGAGASVRLGAGTALFVEAAPVGEVSYSAGIAQRW